MAPARPTTCTLLSVVLGKPFVALSAGHDTASQEQTVGLSLGWTFGG